MGEEPSACAGPLQPCMERSDQKSCPRRRLPRSIDDRLDLERRAARGSRERRCRSALEAEPAHTSRRPLRRRDGMSRRRGPATPSASPTSASARPHPTGRADHAPRTGPGDRAAAPVASVSTRRGTASSRRASGRAPRPCSGGRWPFPAAGARRATASSRRCPLRCPNGNSSALAATASRAGSRRSG